jgi:regulatory protein
MSFEVRKVDIERYTEEELQEKVMETALRILDCTMKSVTAMKQSLTRRGYPTELATATVERLVELGLLDDLAYATALARAQMLGKSRSRQLAQHWLQQQGFEDSIITEALEAVDEADEQGAAAEFVRQKAQQALNATRGDCEQNRALRRVLGQAARRGISYDLARAVFFEVWEP